MPVRLPGELGPRNPLQAVNSCSAQRRARNDAPRVVPAECMTYFTPDCSISRWTSAIWAETEAEAVPI